MGMTRFYSAAEYFMDTIRRQYRDELLARFKELSSTSLEAGIKRGQIVIEFLNEFPTHYTDYLSVFGVKQPTITKLRALVEHPYMALTYWKPPPRYTDCYAVLTLRPLSKFLDFCEVWPTKPSFLNADETYKYDLTNVTEEHVVEYKNAYWLGRSQRNNKPAAAVVTIRPPNKFLNEMVCGDCLDLIPQLADLSIDAVITSPPYAEQRDGFYESIPEAEYPDWFVNVMTALRPKLTDTGSVLVVVRSHIKDGCVSDYVMRTRLAVRAAGWFECDELYWLKRDAPPLGSIKRPRHTVENILWFSKAKQPFIDVKACGHFSNRLGFFGSNRFDDQVIKQYSYDAQRDRARITDVFEACISGSSHDVMHPAMFPPDLAHQLIRTFSKQAGTILDPFVGSGTTAVEACKLHRNYIGFDMEEKCVRMANRQLKRL
jgi:site-specific DNA-methyltransferase (adenine-specific)/site-specific DNA-methyltransferase (cytosine-N4-specific)